MYGLHIFETLKWKPFIGYKLRLKTFHAGLEPRWNAFYFRSKTMLKQNNVTRTLTDAKTCCTVYWLTGLWKASPYRKLFFPSLAAKKSVPKTYIQIVDFTDSLFNFTPLVNTYLQKSIKKIITIYAFINL